LPSTLIQNSEQWAVVGELAPSKVLFMMIAEKCPFYKLSAIDTASATIRQRIDVVGKDEQKGGRLLTAR
jgi:hypothetical protein